MADNTNPGVDVTIRAPLDRLEQDLARAQANLAKFDRVSGHKSLEKLGMVSKETDDNLSELETQLVDTARAQAQFDAANVNSTKALARQNAALESATSRYEDHAAAARETGKSALGMASETLALATHLKFAAVAAYVAIPAFRGMVNAIVASSAVTGALGAALRVLGPAAVSAAGAMVSALGPAMAFLSRIALPILAIVAAWQALNAVITRGSDLLSKYADAQRNLMPDADANLAKLTKFQESGITAEQVQLATELGARLNVAKKTIGDFFEAQFNLTDPALKLQQIWVRIVELIAAAVEKMNEFISRFPEFVEFMKTVMKWTPIGMAVRAGTAVTDAMAGPLPPPPSRDQLLAAAKQRLAGAMGAAAVGGEDNKIGNNFAVRWGDAIDKLANKTSKAKEETTKTITEFDRLEKSMARSAAVQEAEARAVDLGVGEHARLRAELRLQEAALQTIASTGEGKMEDFAERIKKLADRFGNAAQKAAELKLASDIKFTGDTVFLSDAEKHIASVLRQIHGAEWKNMMKSPAADAMRFNDNLKLIVDTVRDIGKEISQGVVHALMEGKNVGEALQQTLKNLSAKLADKTIENLLSGEWTKALISGISAAATFLASTFMGDDKNAKALEKAKQNFAAMANDITKFNAAAAGFDLSPLIGEMTSLTEQFVKLGSAALDAHDSAAFDKIHATFQHGLDRIVQSYLGLTASLSESGKGMAQAKADAEGMKDAILQAGGSLEIAADISQRGLLSAINRIKASLKSTLQADIFNATGKGFINDIQALVTERNQLLAEGNADPALIQAHFAAMAQKIVNDAGLIGDSFNDLVQRFPDLTGAVTESASALADQAKAASDAADQAKETAIKFQESLDSVARGIIDYVNNLRVGPSTSLSPAAALAVATQTTNATLALAQANNLDALNRITSDVDNELRAARAFYGSSTAYQQIEQQRIQQLLALPAVAQSTDPVVTALLGVQQRVDTTNTNTSATNAALNSGGQTAAQLLFASVQNLQSAVANLGSIISQLSSVFATLFNGAGWLNSLNSLQTTAAQQLQLLNQQLAGNQGIVTAPATTVTSPFGVITSSTDLVPGSAVNNTLVLALNKIVYNTAATSENTKILATNANSTSTRGYSGKLAAGGGIMPHELAIFGEHHPHGPFFARAGGQPIPVTPGMPSLGALNDNHRLEVRLDMLIQVLSSVGAALLNDGRRLSKEERETVANALDNLGRTIKAESRMDRTNPQNQKAA